MGSSVGILGCSCCGMALACKKGHTNHSPSYGFFYDASKKYAVLIR